MHRQDSASMRGPFTQYLREKGVLDESVQRRLMTECLDFRDIIGALALRFGLLDPIEVENVLDSMDDDAYFGQRAIEMGFLTQGEVDALLDVQELEEILEVGIWLVLSGVVSRYRLINLVGDFLGRVDADANLRIKPE